MGAGQDMSKSECCLSVWSWWASLKDWSQRVPIEEIMSSEGDPEAGSMAFEVCLAD